MKPTPTPSMSAPSIIDLDASGAHRQPIPTCPKTPTPPGRARTSRSTRWSSVPAPTAASRTWQPPTTSSRANKIAKGVRGIIIPATMAVYRECIVRGYTDHLHRCRVHRLHPHLRSLPGRLHGHPGPGRALRLHHQPQLCGPHGPCGQRGLSGQPRRRRGQRA